jgi:hypothetical protein
VKLCKEGPRRGNIEYIRSEKAKIPERSQRGGAAVLDGLKALSGAKWQPKPVGTIELSERREQSFKDTFLGIISRHPYAARFIL